MNSLIVEKYSKIRKLEPSIKAYALGISLGIYELGVPIKT